jgi:hypothetical protein
MWDGASVQPMACEVYDATIGDLNFTQRSKVSAMTVAAFGEVWWFYPSSGSTENDKAVVFNYKEGTWTLHTLSRLCGYDSRHLQLSHDGVVRLVRLRARDRHDMGRLALR